jgi:hypothetical protein
MGEERTVGLGRWRFGAILLLIAALVTAQSLLHLVVVLRLGEIGTFVDLDRSNGLPDIVSTIALATASAGAALLAHRCSGVVRRASGGASLLLGGLTLADLLHDGAHPMRRGGPLVIVAVAMTLVLLAVVARHSSTVFGVTVVAATLALAGSFLVGGLERFDPARFQRERGDPITERQIVLKEGLELLGWSLVALALWDEAIRRGRLESTTGRASRAPAPSTRRVV